jgi:hypothetical protein
VLPRVSRWVGAPPIEEEAGRWGDSTGADGRSNGIRILEPGLIEERRGPAIIRGSVRGEGDIVSGWSFGEGQKRVKRTAGPVDRLVSMTICSDLVSSAGR